jgi:alkyl hydroperoxide reductase subunit AhpF
MKRRYEQYVEVLEKNPELQLKLESSKQIASVNDLLENGSLVSSEDYISWVNGEEEKTCGKRMLKVSHMEWLRLFLNPEGGRGQRP